MDLVLDTATRILTEDNRRLKELAKPIDQLKGENLPFLTEVRYRVKIKDFALPVMYVPLAVAEDPLIKELNGKSIAQMLARKGIRPSDDDWEECRDAIARKILRIRCKHDFSFLAVAILRIKDKDGGEDKPLLMHRPQFKLLEEMEEMRLSHHPIYIILLKARQWGGSTLIQCYMFWIQIFWKKSWNSITVAHVSSASAEVKGMFSKLMSYLPLWLLHEDGEVYDEKERKMRPFEGAPNIDIVPARNFKVKTGSAESPNSARGGDSAMSHCTEVAFWRKTENRTPEQIVRSACSGKLYVPFSLEVFESTADGTGNFFHDEWLRAKEGKSDKKPVFVAWFEIEQLTLPFDSPEERKAFAQALLDNRLDNDRSKVVWGALLWRLFCEGATLEALNWYIHEAKKHRDHASLAAEYPSDDVEAFANSGSMIFDMYTLDQMRKTCQKPVLVGDIKAAGTDGDEALTDIHFVAEENGPLKVWETPDRDIEVSDRYVVVVDIGGRGEKADFSDILVIDRYWMMEADIPIVVAEWHGHIRHDLLAWKAAQMARLYCDALLVIESNTMETREKERQLDGDLAPYILDVIYDHYENLYTRPAQQGKGRIIDGKDVMLGFHTNTSTKPAIIFNLQRLVEEGGYKENNPDALTEMSYYEKRADGTLGNAEGENRHDDMVMTRAIGLWVSQKMPLPKIVNRAPASAPRPMTEATI